MSFTLHVEHEIIDGKTVLEKFENVESINNPPMIETMHLKFDDDRDDKKIRYGKIVKVT